MKLVWWDPLVGLWDFLLGSHSLVTLHQYWSQYLTKLRLFYNLQQRGHRSESGRHAQSDVDFLLMIDYTHSAWLSDAAHFRSVHDTCRAAAEVRGLPRLAALPSLGGLAYLRGRAW